jgi:aspartyl-tRNA(Asn)/glutamyl-tRNA(Gln) amidotransferase subunit C
MPGKLSRDEVRRIAALAHLALSDDETDLFTRQLAGILEYAEELTSLDTSGVEPTAHVLGRLSVDRADDPAPSLPRDDAMANAPDASSGQMFFRVPRVIG